MNKRELAAVVVSGLAAAPGLTFGYFRDDWLLLWSVIDPVSAPTGAAGVFPRPVAMGLWKAATLVNDHPLAMHLPVFLLWIAGAALMCDVARRLGLRRGAWIAVAWWGTHAALLELRVWSAASNASLGVTLGLLAWWLVLRRPSSKPGLFVSVTLVLMAALARADVLAMLIPLMAWSSVAPRRVWLLMGLPLAGLGLVATLLAADRFGFDLAHAGEALRRVVVPWGAALPSGAAMLLGGFLIPATAWSAWRLRAHPRWCGLVVMTGAVVLAQSALPWGAAGRYQAIPVAATALLLARVATATPVQAVLGLMVLAHAATTWRGSTVVDLRERARVETELYRFAKGQPVTTTVTLDPPPVIGWHDSEADAENVISTAMRQNVDVRFASSGSRWIYDRTSWSHAEP